MGLIQYGPGEIVVYNGIIAEWSLIQFFIDVRISNTIRKANEEELVKYRNRK